MASDEPSGPRPVPSDTARAEAFSDGVLAIVITLLVLDLRPSEHKPGQLLSALLRQWPTYLAYVTSYLYVGVVWLNHKAAFSRIRLMDRGLHWANLGILFMTALLPFPTAVMSHAIEQGNPADARTSVALYALVGSLRAPAGSCSSTISTATRNWSTTTSPTASFRASATGSSSESSPTPPPECSAG